MCGSVDPCVRTSCYTYHTMNLSTRLVIGAEFGPILLFFIAGRLTDFYSAVAILVGSTLLAILVNYWLERRVPWLPVLSALFVVFGGLITLIWSNPDAIIITDTLYYLTASSALGISLYRGTPLLKTLFGGVFALSDAGWWKLTWRWCVFLLIAALANELARYLLTPAEWIDYRFVKTIIITSFACYQLTLSKKYRLAEESNWLGFRITSPK